MRCMTSALFPKGWTNGTRFRTASLILSGTVAHFGQSDGMRNGKSWSGREIPALLLGLIGIIVKSEDGPPVSRLAPPPLQIPRGRGILIAKRSGAGGRGAATVGMNASQFVAWF